MFAVIKTGGKQYRVSAEDKITVMALAGEPGDKVTFEDVLFTGKDGAADFAPKVKVTGLKELPRRVISHALNQIATARRYAEEHETFYERVNVIVAHMGGGITVALATRNGPVTLRILNPGEKLEVMP